MTSHAMIEKVKNDDYNDWKILKKSTSIFNVWNFYCNYPLIFYTNVYLDSILYV